MAAYTLLDLPLGIAGTLGQAFTQGKAVTDEIVASEAGQASAAVHSWAPGRLFVAALFDFGGALSNAAKKGESAILFDNVDATYEALTWYDRVQVDQKTVQTRLADLAKHYDFACAS